MLLRCILLINNSKVHCPDTQVCLKTTRKKKRKKKQNTSGLLQENLANFLFQDQGNICLLLLWQLVVKYKHKSLGDNEANYLTFASIVKLFG